MVRPGQHQQTILVSRHIPCKAQHRRVCIRIESIVCVHTNRVVLVILVQQCFVRGVVEFHQAKDTSKRCRGSDSPGCGIGFSGERQITGQRVYQVGADGVCDAELRSGLGG